MSKRHQSRLKKELEISILSADLPTNPNWDQTSGGNSSLESERSNLDFDSETVAGSSEGNFDRYLDIHENNSAVLDIFHSRLDFPWSSDRVLMRKYHGGTSKAFL